jgi:cytochrome c oxidase cbb3-type subunit IV
MLRRILENTECADVYAIIGLIFFVLSFAGIIIWLIKADKKYLKKMKNLPLEDDNQNTINTTGDNNENE